MKPRLKMVLRHLALPPLPIILALTAVCAVGLAWALTGEGRSIATYAIYTLSFYTLCTLTAYIVIKAPSRIRELKRRLYSTKYGSKYKEDIDFRTRVSLYTTLALNLGNVALNILWGLLNQTRWFFVLAFYYGTLTAMRFIISVYSRRHKVGEDLLSEWKRARACAFVMLLINLSLSGVVLMMMYQSRGFRYEGMLIYVMAAYSFYHIIRTVIDFIRLRRFASPILTMIKEISLASALVSMLSLETAMFAAFSDGMSVADQRIFIAATGAGICVIVSAMSVYTLINATKNIRKLVNKND